MSKNGDLINQYFNQIMGDPIEQELAEGDGNHTEAVPVQTGQMRFAGGRTLDTREYNLHLIGAADFLDEEVRGQPKWLHPRGGDYRTHAPKSLVNRAMQLRDKNRRAFGFSSY